MANIENSQYDNLSAKGSEQPEKAEAGPVALVGRLKPEVDQIGRTAKIHARLAVAAEKNAALVTLLKAFDYAF